MKVPNLRWLNSLFLKSPLLVLHKYTTHLACNTAKFQSFWRTRVAGDGSNSSSSSNLPLSSLATVPLIINATLSEIQRTPVLAANDSRAIRVVPGSLPSPRSQIFTLRLSIFCGGVQKFEISVIIRVMYQSKRIERGAQATADRGSIACHADS